MASCIDCIHHEICQNLAGGPFNVIDADTSCTDFKDRSRFVELPIIDDYEETKLLDKAIDYCYKVAMSSNPNIRVEYKAEHMRLCGWLGDLRRRIEAEQALKERENSD